MTLFTYCKTEYYFCAHNLLVAITPKKNPFDVLIFRVGL